MKYLKRWEGKLKPCPFCGNPGHMQANRCQTSNMRGERLGTRTHYFAGCFDGPCMVHPHSSEEVPEFAAERWNERTRD